MQSFSLINDSTIFLLLALAILLGMAVLVRYVSQKTDTTTSTSLLTTEATLTGVLVTVLIFESLGVAALAIGPTNPFSNIRNAHVAQVFSGCPDYIESDCRKYDGGGINYDPLNIEDSTYRYEAVTQNQINSTEVLGPVDRMKIFLSNLFTNGFVVTNDRQGSYDEITTQDNQFIQDNDPQGRGGNPTWNSIVDGFNEAVTSFGSRVTAFFSGIGQAVSSGTTAISNFVAGLFGTSDAEIVAVTNQDTATRDIAYITEEDANQRALEHDREELENTERMEQDQQSEGTGSNNSQESVDSYDAGDGDTTNTDPVDGWDKPGVTDTNGGDTGWYDTDNTVDFNGFGDDTQTGGDNRDYGDLNGNTGPTDNSPVETGNTVDFNGFGDDTQTGGDNLDPQSTEVDFGNNNDLWNGFVDTWIDGVNDFFEFDGFDFGFGGWFDGGGGGGDNGGAGRYNIMQY